MAKAKHSDANNQLVDSDVTEGKAEAGDSNGTNDQEQESVVVKAKTGHGEKSEVIRQILASGITKPALIIEEAARQGVHLNAGLVAAVKSKHLSRKVKVKVKVKAPAPVAAPGQPLDLFQILALNKRLAAAGGSEIVLQAFKIVEGFTKEFGSLEVAKQAIEDLEELKAGLKV